jgi:hypothetical protein
MMTVSKIQYASGLFHALQKKKNYHDFLLPSAKYLALCGNNVSLDCEKSKKFLHYVNHYFDRVWLIPSWTEIGHYKGEKSLFTNQLDNLYTFLHEKGLKNIMVGNKTEDCPPKFLVYSSPMILQTPISAYQHSYKCYKRTLDYTQDGLKPIQDIRLQRIYLSEYDTHASIIDKYKTLYPTLPIVSICSEYNYMLGIKRIDYEDENMYMIYPNSNLIINFHGMHYGKGFQQNGIVTHEDNVSYAMNDYQLENYKRDATYDLPMGIVPSTTMT